MCRCKIIKLKTIYECCRVSAMIMLSYMAGILRHYGNVNYHHLSEPRDKDFFSLHLWLKSGKYSIRILFQKMF